MIKKPTKKGVTDVAAFSASATAGMMLSNGVVGMLPQSKFTKPALAIAALVLAASIKGAGTGSDVAKGMATGVALANIKDVAVQAIQPLVPTYDNPNAFQKFITDSTGMNGFQNDQNMQFLPFDSGLNGIDEPEYAPFEEVADPLMA